MPTLAELRQSSEQNLLIEIWLKLDELLTAGGGVTAEGEAFIGFVGGPVVTPSGNFVRPANATPYASGDLVANDVDAGDVVPLSWAAARIAAASFMVRRARLKKSGTTVTLANFRLHLYGAVPTVTNGDNGAWVSPHGSYLGSIDLDMSGANGRVFSDAAEVIGIPSVGSEVNVKLASGSTVYGLLEARAAYVPASGETFTCELEILQN